MREVKTPKKPLLYYYIIAMMVLLLFNLLAMPWLTEHQIREVDYNTFVTMTEQKEIGQVEIQEQSNRILFTGKDNKTIYKTAIVPDDGLVQRLLDAGISDIWAKSVSKEHARILQRIGARHIINAETDAGKRVGHLVSGNYLDYIELEGAYSVVKIHTPPHVVGYSIEDARVHERFGITVVGVKSPGKEFEYGSKELIMHRNDELIIMGKQDQIDKFLRG